MINKKEIIKSINDKDLEIKISKILDKINLTMNKHLLTCTEFLSPIELSTILEILKFQNINYKVFGGYDNSERNKIIFADEYTDIQEQDFNISILEVSYNTKFSKTLAHGDYMGSILGLGITRDLIGDILVEDNRAIIFIDNTIADFITISYEYVGKTKVKCNFLDFYKENSQEREIKNISLSSLRVDNVISSIFNLSRSTSKELIQKERVFINYQVAKDSGKQINNNDIISVRSYGKFQFLEVTGTTKKKKLRADIIIY